MATQMKDHARPFIPARLLPVVDELAKIEGYTRSGMLGRLIEEGIAAYKRQLAEDPPLALPAPTVQPPRQTAPPPPAPPPAPPGNALVPFIKQGSTRWYDMKAVCAYLTIGMEVLAAEIDPKDDVLTFGGKSYIDYDRGIATACSLSSNERHSKLLKEWANNLENS